MIHGHMKGGTLIRVSNLPAARKMGSIAVRFRRRYIWVQRMLMDFAISIQILRRTGQQVLLFWDAMHPNDFEDRAELAGHERTRPVLSRQ